jgi:hypothetical protein
MDVKLLILNSLYCRSVMRTNIYHFMFALVSKEATTNNEQFLANRDKFLSERTLLVPELVKIHPIPASLWREMQMVPFVMERLTSLIKVHHMMSEMKADVGSFYENNNRPQEASNKSLPAFHQLIQTNLERKKLDIWDILKAVTLRGAGEVFDMEKLEVLGDSFLKFLVSIPLFTNKVNYFYKKSQIIILQKSKNWTPMRLQC